MKNFLLDVILFALFVAELCFHHLPKVMHEVLGVALIIALAVHIAINRRRIAALTKKLTPRKFLALTTDLALTICAAATAVSGVVVSNYLFADLVAYELRRNMTLHQLHVAAPYAMMILLGVHVGLHRRELWQRLLNLTGAEEFYQRRRKFFLAAAMILSGLGGLGLSMNRVGDRILMHHIFATRATELPAVVFALMIVGGVIFFASITVVLDKKFLSR